MVLASVDGPCLNIVNYLGVAKWSFSSSIFPSTFKLIFLSTEECSLLTISLFPPARFFPFLLSLLSVWVLTILPALAGEGNGTPFQYSCLENPMDGGAWKAAVRGVAEGQKRLSDLAAAAADLESTLPRALILSDGESCMLGMLIATGVHCF